ncbi:MAG: hypothetical protein V1860_02835 [bacterium]
MSKAKLKILLSSFIAVMILLAVLKIASAAWEEPTVGCTPPDCNRPTPLYSQTTAQSGPLNVKDMTVNSGLGTIEANKICLCNGVDGTCAPEKCITDWSSEGLWTKDPVSAKIYYNNGNVEIGDGSEIWIQTGITGSWRAVAMSSDGKYQTAANFNGQLQVSNNSGITWSAKGPADQNWTGVAVSSDGQYQMAVSWSSSVGGGVIYSSSDLGNSWGIIGTGFTSGDWKTAAMTPDGKYRIAARVGATGRVALSKDSGASWVNTSAPIKDWQSVAISSDGKYQAAVNSNGEIYISNNFGNFTSWKAKGPSETWAAVDMSSDGQRLTAVTSTGKIYASSDFGESWNLKKTIAEKLTSVAISSDGKIQMICADNSQMYASADFGETWTEEGAAKKWTGVAMSSDGSIKTAVTDSEFIYIKGISGAPAEKLQINGGAGTARLRITDTDENPELQLQYGAGGSGHWALYNNQSNDALTIWGGGDNRMAFLQNGNIGIGTIAPSEKLEVAGTVKATKFIGDGSELTGIVSNLPPNQINYIDRGVWSIDSSSYTRYGEYSQIFIGNDGLPVILATYESNYQTSSNHIYLVKCSDKECSSKVSDIFLVDMDGPRPIKFATSTTGTVFVYQNGQDVSFRKCMDEICTGGSYSNYISQGVAGSVAIGGDGFPVITYSNISGTYIAHCNDLGCNNLTRKNINEIGLVNYNETLPIAIGADGFPVIVNIASGKINVLKCGNNKCDSGNILTTVTPDITPFYMSELSLAIGADGFPIISYSVAPEYGKFYVQVLKCGDAACSGGENKITYINDGINSRWNSQYPSPCSVSIGNDGLPVLYFKADIPLTIAPFSKRTLQVVKCGDKYCENGNTITEVDDEYVGYDSSMAIGADGYPVISYSRDIRDFTTYGMKPIIDLKVLKCNSDSCAGISGGSGSSLPFGAAGQTLRHNGTDWIADSNLLNTGTNVGIGTASPAEKLEIGAGSGTYARLRITDIEENPELQLQYGPALQAHWGIFSDRSNGNSLNLWSWNGADANAGNRLTILQSGNIGIGTNTPDAKLEVAGQVKITEDQIHSGTDPINISLAGSAEIESVSGGSGIYVYVNKAYVASTKGLSIINVASPENPVLMGTVAGDISQCYLGAYNKLFAVGASGFKAIDITDPNHPFVAGSSSLTGAGMCQVPYLVGRPDPFLTLGYYYVAAGDLYIVEAYINKSDTNTVYIFPVKTDGKASGKLIPGDNYLYAVQKSIGLAIYDITKPDKPKLQGSFSETTIKDMDILDNYAYIAAGTNLKIINISDASHPFLAKTYNTEKEISKIFISGNYAYLTIKESATASRVEILNISDINNIISLGSYVENNSAVSNILYAANNKIYVNDDLNKKFKVLETSVSSTKSSLIIKANSVGSAVYVDQLGTGYAGEFNGTVKATKFIGDGSELTGVSGIGLSNLKDISAWTIGNVPAGASVTYGNGLFVSVDHQVIMTSPDGVNWATIRNDAEPDSYWKSVTYGNGLFVAVADTGVKLVMTSPDGINWTLRNGAIDKQWESVTYGNGLFVAVAYQGIMTSPDGINWTSRNGAGADYYWRSLTYGNGLFVAVSATGNKVMTSPDGINWTIRNGAADNWWASVTYGDGLFVAVANTGSGNRVMTSQDGINWTIRNSVADIEWSSVTYGDGLFVAVASVHNASDSYTNQLVMISNDGINWVLKNSANSKEWLSVIYSNGLFVAVGHDSPYIYNPGNNAMKADLINVSGGSSGSLPAGASGQTLRYNGTAWIADSNLYNNGTNIGIGTASPLEKLHISAGAGTYARLRIADTDAGENAELQLQYGTGGNDHWSLYNNQLTFRIWGGGADRFTILQNGNVGIGTADPGANKLKVAGAAEITGDLTVGGKFNASGADLAEEFSSAEDIPEGTVVVMDNLGYKSIKPCAHPYDEKVIGVVSDNASIIMGRLKNNNKEVIAISGVVTVRTTNENGNIEKGDLLTSSEIKGRAMKASDERAGTIIGKALEECNNKYCEIKAIINLQ